MMSCMVLMSTTMRLELSLPWLLVELKLETDLINQYNQAVQNFADGALKLLGEMEEKKKPIGE